jgi:hypothetical protein
MHPPALRLWRGRVYGGLAEGGKVEMELEGDVGGEVRVRDFSWPRSPTQRVEREALKCKHACPLSTSILSQFGEHAKQ